MAWWVVHLACWVVVNLAWVVLDLAWVVVHLAWVVWLAWWVVHPAWWVVHLDQLAVAWMVQVQILTLFWDVDDGHTELQSCYDDLFSPYT